MNSADIIQNNKELIIEKWLGNVERKVPPSSKHSRPALRNDIPELIDNLVQALRERLDWDKLHSGIKHGRQRALFEDYSLLDVLREYRLIKEVIFEIIDRNGQITPEERNQIMITIDKSIEQTGEIFFRLRQQSDKAAKEAAEKKALELQALHEIRDQFIAIISHDLRNPLSHIMQAAELIRRNWPAEYAEDRLLTIINDSARRADQLIQNLLDVNVIRSGGNIPITVGPCNLTNEIKSAVESFEVNSHQPFKVNADSDVTGQWDCKALRRALDNLLQNAIKYGKPGGVITVLCKRNEENTILAVHNEGNPIPEEQQTRIFGEFFRGRVSRRGWGLGLTLVKGVAQAHGGVASVSSSPEKGTTFSISLPNKPAAGDIR